MIIELDFCVFQLSSLSPFLEHADVAFLKKTQQSKNSACILSVDDYGGPWGLDDSNSQAVQRPTQENAML